MGDSYTIKPEIMQELLFVNCLDLALMHALFGFGHMKHEAQLQNVVHLKQANLTLSILFLS